MSRNIVPKEEMKRTAKRNLTFVYHREDLFSYMFLGKSEQTAIVLIAARQLVEQIRLTVPELTGLAWWFEREDIRNYMT